MSASLHLLSGGAANGLVSRLQGRFTEQTGLQIHGTFSAVGQMKQALLAGQPCDLVILTEALVRELVASGHLEGATARRVGVVRTGLGVPAGQVAPPMSTAQQLAQALQQASGVYMADPLKATAGIHFMKVLRKLGLDLSLGPRLRPFADGQTAMAAMVRDSGPAGQILIGCTQITEILNTEGVRSVGLLPPQFELATVYSAAVVKGSGHSRAAAAMIELLCQPEQARLRQACGFDSDPA